MFDYLTKLLTHKGFMPHGHCYLWKPEILWMHVISDIIIAIAYYSIPLTLVILIMKRKSFPLKWVLTLFAMFIFLCGTTNIIDLITQWTPIYRLEGLVKLLTALVSIATAIALYPLLPRLLEAADKLEKEVKDN